MSGQSTFEFISAISPPKPETPEWLVWLIVAAAVVLIIGLDVLRKHIAWSIIREAICRVFAGKPLDGVNVAFRGIQPEALCLPIRRAVRRRLEPGQKLCVMQLKVALHNPLLLLAGVADVDVVCDFTVDGEALLAA